MIVVSKKLGEFIDIHKYEPNPFIRKVKYPLIVQIKTDIIKYKDANNKIHTGTVVTKKYSAPKKILKRKLHMKKFGDALRSNEDNFATIGEMVKMEMVNKKDDDTIAIRNIDDIINNIQPTQSYKPVKVFAPNETTNIEKEEYKLLLRNIPTEYSIQEMSSILKSHLKEYGLIKSIRLMKDKYNTLLIRDIAFIEFFYKKDMDKLLNSNKKIIIDNSIINLEKMHTDNRDRRRR